MTLGELSALPRHLLLRRLREAEARAERAERERDAAISAHALLAAERDRGATATSRAWLAWRDDMRAKLDAERTRAERAEMRLARWALAAFFRSWCWELRATRCECGHVGLVHNHATGACRSDCGCTAFVARTSPIDSDSGAAVASLNTATEAT